MFGSAVLSLISQDRARVVRWSKVSSSLWNLLTITSLHLCCGSHSERWEAAPEILSNPDQSVLLCVHMMSWTQSQVSIVSPKLRPAEKTSLPVGPSSLFGSQPAYLVALLATEPSPSKSIQVTRWRIIPQPLRHAALVRLILLSGCTLPGAAKNSVCNKTLNLQWAKEAEFYTFGWIFFFPLFLSL